MSKVIIISAPSGTGKSTIVRYLQEQAPDLGLRFSISATSRAPRGTEQDGVEYYFFSTEAFRKRIEEGGFLEYEEVYPGRFYGTLTSEVERIFATGDNVIFDVDAVGGINIKKHYGQEALSIFILPPSLEALRHRLVSRGTDTMEVIEMRLGKAEREMALAEAFDCTFVNDDLEACCQEVERAVRAFLQQAQD